jgi:FAD/FMN-containing dehydrogenase/Fe-S oxidoreductase
VNEKFSGSELERDLRRALGPGCDVRFDAGARALYATDSSNYRQEPIAVVVPRSRAEILRAVEVCRAHGAPILARGGGTSLAGQTCNEAVVFDFSKYYNRVLELSADGAYARVEPGIVLDELRERAKAFGLTFGPDPATHRRCTLGGMIGNDSCGVHSQYAGRTIDNVLELEVLTYDGLVLKVGMTSESELERRCAKEGREGEIYRGLRKIRDRYAELIRARYPKIPRRVSGYSLDELLPEAGFHVGRALTGTESTCVLILEAKLKLVPARAERALTIVGFTDIYAAAAAVPALAKEDPVGLEAFDDRLVELIRIKHRFENDLQLLPEGNSWLLVEYGENNREELDARIARAERHLHERADVLGFNTYRKPEDQERIWKVREAGLGVTAFVPGQEDTWEGWEDSAVPPEKMSGYLRELRALYGKFGYEGVFYGHFGQGCLHTRITFDLVSRGGIEKYHRFSVEAAKLVVKYGGSLSGEHGDGQSRAELLPIMFGNELVDAFREFKQLWDPQNKMNPGKMVNAFGNTENLRLGTGYAPWDPETVFRYPDDRFSFARASLRCVGVGACRQHKGGVMCPSYQITREEKHSTRGRARLLFEMCEGKTLPRQWRNEPVKEALELCLSCKGCKGECPVNVDMASYKAEFLHHYYRGRLRPREAYAFGFIGLWSRIASLAPGVANFFTQTKGLARIAKFAAGMHPHRSIPRFAPETFRDWFGKRQASFPKGIHREFGIDALAAESRPEVLLWPDTFTNHFEPKIAIAAVTALEAAGFRVRIPRRDFCCGRPLYDYGFLPTARRWLRRILTELGGEIRAGLPLIFLEPSCASVFRDELRNLFPNDPDAIRLGKQSRLLAEFLREEAPEFAWPRLANRVLVQGHCHERSILDFEQEILLLGRVAGAVDLIPSGCCGMAGAFGFENAHYVLSQKLGHAALFPAVAGLESDAILLANGFSCREQIRQGTGREVLHLAEFLALAVAAERGAVPQEQAS